MTIASIPHKIGELNLAVLTMPMDDELEQYEKLIQLIQEMIQHDQDLREKYSVGEKFRFVHDRLQGLLTHIESQKNAQQVKIQSATAEDNTNQVLVYVYLYNAQGTLLRSWSPMLTPKVFYEYSVNRPIYTEKNFVDSLIKGKSNKQQHGYLVVRVKPEDIISTAESAIKDNIGNPVIKVREGSLRFENLVLFSHNGQNYNVTSQGEFVKKE